MRISLKNYNFSDLLFIVLLYIYIFQPPIINKLFFISIEALIFFLVFFLRPSAIVQIFTTFKIELSLLSTIIIYSLFRDMFSSEIVYSDRFIAWGFQTFIFGTVILWYFQYKKESLFGLIYWSGFIAALFSVSLLLIPSFDRWYETIQLDGYYEIYKNFKVRYRAYGISENLTFTYSAVMGLFAGYSLLLVKKNIFFVIPFFIFLIAVMFNARIGFVPIIFFIFYFLFIQHDIKILIRFFFASLVLVFLFYITLVFLGINIDNLVLFSNLDWVLNFFKEILNYGAVDSSSTLGIMFDKFIIIPDDSIVHFFFGRGVSLFGLDTHSSDMGWILQLNYGGYFFLLLLIFFLLYCFHRLIHTLGITHWFTGVFILSMVVLNTKGFIFAATPGGRLFFLLYMYFIVRCQSFKMIEYPKRY